MTTDEARAALLKWTRNYEHTELVDTLIAAVRAEGPDIDTMRTELFEQAERADALEAKLAALREAVEGWVPQHSSACSAQDDDDDCICGTSDVYAAALAATPAEEERT